MIYTNTTIIDFETTGLNPETDKIIELALIRIREGKIIGTLSYLLNPCCDIPKYITDITGITNSDVEKCPTIEQILPWVISIIGDSLLVAHNAIFDLHFLNVQNQKYRGKSIKNNFIDTRAICINKYPYQSHKLDIMCKQLNIELKDAHRALNDVTATWELLQKLNLEVDVKEYLNKLYYFKKHGEPAWYPKNSIIIGL